MKKTFPPEFLELWREVSCKAAFVQDAPMIEGRHDCENCGGWGFMVTFIAAHGPYNSPSTMHGDVSHYHDGKWWTGRHATATCPVCKGLNNVPVLVEETPAVHGKRQLAGEVAEKMPIGWQTSKVVKAEYRKWVEKLQEAK